MFVLDSLMISGIEWAIRTVVTAAEAEMNDDTALRNQLLAAEMRRETGEMSDEEFAGIETDLLARIRELKERREGPGALGFGEVPIETTSGSTIHVEATISGDFHDPVPAGNLALPLPPRRMARTTRTTRATRTARTARTARTKSR